MLSFLTPEIQNVLALMTVAFAFAWLVSGALRGKRRGSCCASGGCNKGKTVPPSNDFIPLEMLDGK